MIRFILKKKWRDGVSGAEGEQIVTHTEECPVLEQALSAGGFSEYGYEFYQLVGVEAVKERKG